MNKLGYRDIQKELRAYLDNNDFSKKNIYISSEKMRDNWISIDWLGSDNMVFSRVDVNSLMTLIVRMQLPNTSKITISHEKLDDEIYDEIGLLFDTIEDWFCRADTITYPFSKKIFGARIKPTPKIFSDQKGTVLEKIVELEITFDYNQNA